jgi:HK97 family phage major capsid protein
MCGERMQTMSDIAKLADKRAHLLVEARGIAVEAADKGIALEGEDKVRFEKLVAEAGVIAEALRAEKASDEARKSADEARAEFAAVVNPTAPKAATDNDRLRAIGMAGGIDTFEYRDITTTTGLTNPVSVFNRVNVIAGQINPYINSAVVDVIQVATGNNIKFPTVTALGTTAGSVAEAGSITEDDFTGSALSLTPTKFAVLVQVSDELIQDAAFDVAAMISEAAGQEMAIAHGSVASTAVVTAAGTGGTAAGTVLYTYAELVALQYSVKQQYRTAPKSGFLMSDTALGQILGTTSASLPLFQPGGAGGVDRLLGKPVYTAPGIAVPATGVKGVLFGDLGQIKTALVGGVTVEASREFAWNLGLVSYKVQVRGATGLAQSSAVKFLKNA